MSGDLWGPFGQSSAELERAASARRFWGAAGWALLGVPLAVLAVWVGVLAFRADPVGAGVMLGGCVWALAVVYCFHRSDR